MKQGWEIKEFEDCLEKVVYTNKIQRKDFLEVGDYPIISQEQDFINGYWDNSNDLFVVKKPIVIFGDHTQVLKYVDFDFVLGADGVKILQPTNSIEPRFFYYFLQNINLGSLGYARHYRLLKEIEVSYPKSLPEQQRIVSILDEAFAAIAKAKANAEQNLQNAKELFESYLHNVFENKGDDWEEVLIGEVSELIDSLHQTPTYSDSGYAMVRVTEIKGGYLKTEKALRVNESVYNEFSKRHKPKDGDIIMSRVGASFGVCAFVHNNELFCLGQNTVFIIPKINPTLMFYFLKSPVAREQMNNLASGSAQPTISLKSIKAIKMNLPPVEKQQEIVQKIDVLFDKCKKLEAIYTQKIADLEETKKSILQKAFSGELNTLN